MMPFLSITDGALNCPSVLREAFKESLDMAILSPSLKISWSRDVYVF